METKLVSELLNINRQKWVYSIKINTMYKIMKTIIQKFKCEVRQSPNEQNFMLE